MGNDISSDDGHDNGIVGDYKLQKLIGNGGFGQVYMAKPLLGSIRSVHNKVSFLESCTKT